MTMLGLTRESNLGNSAVAETHATARLRHALAADLGPRYHVHDFLGSGAYATVWKVYDRITEEMVAVKRFGGHIARAGGFYRELQALFRLRHERIDKVINLSESPGAQGTSSWNTAPAGACAPPYSGQVIGEYAARRSGRGCWPCNSPRAWRRRTATAWFTAI